jgi:hypothetical protein
MRKPRRSLKRFYAMRASRAGCESEVIIADNESAEHRRLFVLNLKIATRFNRNSGQAGVASVTRSPEYQKIWIAAFAAMTNGEALVFS